MLEDCTESCVPCGLHQPVRNNYFDGKFLVSRDFTGEQDYLRGHRQMHNAYLHGSGTVCGLKLVEHPAEQCRREFVVCEPGMALDCCGQEIIVPERSLVRVRDLIEADEDLKAALDGKKHLFVSIERCDAGAEPVPLILPTCDTPESKEFGRIAEGFRFSLSARSPEEVTPVETPIEPSIEWVHSFTYDGGTPKALHVNDGEKLVQIGVDDPTGANTYAYDLTTHDLQSVLGGPFSVSDTASGREARLVFVAGSGFVERGNGVGVWRANALDALPARVIPTEGDRPRIAVSPLSGTLYVLDVNEDKSRLVAYPRESVSDWLTDAAADAPTESASMTFGHGFGDLTDAAGRGAAMMEVTRDGRFLVLISPDGEPDERLYLIDTATFAGELEADAWRPDGFSRPATERLEAIRWSYDDEYLYVLTRESADGGVLHLTRFELVDENADLVQAGTGVVLRGHGHDLAVAPTDRRAYVLMADPDGATRLTTVDLELVRSFAGEPTEVVLPPSTIRFDGQGRCLSMAPNGDRMYVAVVEAAEPDEPDRAFAERGLVAVIDIKEEDCTLKFDRLIDGCTDCHGDHGGVVLGHIPGYRYVEGQDGPRMRDAASAVGDDLPIDNLTYRRIVPSAVVLKEVIECIVDQGVAEGPPGPRGDAGRDGADGADGLSVTEVEVAMGAPGSQPEAETAPNPGGLRLTLTIPAARDGQDGEDGEDGQGVDDATIGYFDIAEPTVVLDDGSLDIRLPRPESRIPIVATSWRHDEEHPRGDFGAFWEQMKDKGIAIAFEEPVRWRAFRRDDEIGPSTVVELQALVTASGGGAHWVTFPDLELHPIKFSAADVDADKVLTDWELVGVDELIVGFALVGEVELEIGDLTYFRVVFYASQVSQKVEDGGRRVDGARPTDDATGWVDTFRSGFTVKG